MHHIFKLVCLVLVVTASAKISRKVNRMKSLSQADIANALGVHYNGAEHKALGDAAWAAANHAQLPGNVITLNPQNQNGGHAFQLTFGDIVALGGDFYSDTVAICKQPAGAARTQQLFKAFNSLYLGSGTEPNAIKGFLAKEAQAVAAALATGKTAREGYESLGLKHDLIDLEKVSNGRYLKFATWNFDHFGDYHCSIDSYAAAHAQALALAVKRPITNENVQQAFALEAFGMHFLSDRFAAGHIRTPRQDLHNTCHMEAHPSTAAIPGVMAKCMHDEDNNMGLWLKNGNGLVWQAFGDSNYDDPRNAPNRAVATACLKAGIEELQQAFTTGVVPPAPYAAEKFIGIPVDKDNHAPMFKYDAVKRVIQFRNQPANTPLAQVTYTDIQGAKCLAATIDCRWSAPTVGETFQKIRTDVCGLGVLKAVDKAHQLTDKLGWFGDGLEALAKAAGGKALVNHLCPN